MTLTQVVNELRRVRSELNTASNRNQSRRVFQLTAELDRLVALKHKLQTTPMFDGFGRQINAIQCER